MVTYLLRNTITTNFSFGDKGWNVLKKIFPEIGLQTGGCSNRYHLTDNEIAEGLRLVVICEINPTLKVIFNHTYQISWLKETTGELYASYMKEHLEKASIPSKLQSPAPEPETPGQQTALSSKAALLLLNTKEMINVFLDNITHITAEENYVRIHLSDGTDAFIRGPMKNWERMLPSNQFIRLGRSLIINIATVKRLKRISRDEALLTLAEHSPITLGRIASSRLRSIFTKQRKENKFT